MCVIDWNSTCGSPIECSRRWSKRAAAFAPSIAILLSPRDAGRARSSQTARTALPARAEVSHRRAMTSDAPAGLSWCHPQLLKEEVVSKTATRLSKIGVVVIPVTNQDRAIEFYVDTLGFETRADVPFGNGYRWVEVAPPGAETTIAIVPPPEGTPAGDRQTGIGLQTTEIDALHAEMKERGVDVDDEVTRQAPPAGARKTGSGRKTTEMAALPAEMRGRGAAAAAGAPPQGAPVPPLFWFRDPDGNVLMVVDVSGGPA